MSQGSPLSPLLANIALDQLDKELDWKNINYVRYADDIAIFCDSQKAALDILVFVSRYLKEKLHLYLNKEKTKVVNPEELRFLGYSFCKVHGRYVLSVDSNNSQKMMQGIEKQLNRRGNLTYLDRINRLGGFNRGWLNYYKLAQENDLFKLIKLADKTETSMLRDMSAKNMDIVRCLYDSKQFVSMEEWYNTILSRKAALPYIFLPKRGY